MPLAEPPAPALPPFLLGEPKPLRWTKRQYYQIGDLGLLDNKRVELIEGEIIEMQPVGGEHIRGVNVGNRVLGRAFGDAFFVSVQNPFDVSDDIEPQPDLAVIAGDPAALAEAPSTAALIVEVSDSTLRYDRTTKTRLYARAGVPEYWIVNLVDRVLEVYRQPQSSGGYADVRLCRPGETLTPFAAPQAVIAVADLLP